MATTASSSHSEMTQLHSSGREGRLPGGWIGGRLGVCITSGLPDGHTSYAGVTCTRSLQHPWPPPACLLASTSAPNQPPRPGCGSPVQRQRGALLHTHALSVALFDGAGLQAWCRGAVGVQAHFLACDDAAQEGGGGCSGWGGRRAAVGGEQHTKVKAGWC